MKRRRIFGGLAVAASIGIAFGATLAARHRPAPVAAQSNESQLGRLVDPSGAATATRNGRAERLNGGDRVAAGTELHTTAAEASLDFESGTHVTLGRASRVRLVEQSASKRFALEAGELDARVAKLHEGERFVVATSDSEIEVRGTAFRVSIVPGDPTCEGGTPTRLDVSEGVVVVRHGGGESRVAAGQHWPSCPVTVAAAPEPLAAPKPIARSVTPAQSHLAEQNDLFDDGMRKKRSGDSAGAISAFERLVAQYPGSPLAESASVERMRVLAMTDRTRAAGAARVYLRQYPNGFARREAEALVP